MTKPVKFGGVVLIGLLFIALIWMGVGIQECAQKQTAAMQREITYEQDLASVYRRAAELDAARERAIAEKHDALMWEITHETNPVRARQRLAEIDRQLAEKRREYERLAAEQQARSPIDIQREAEIDRKIDEKRRELAAEQQPL